MRREANRRACTHARAHTYTHTCLRRENEAVQAPTLGGVAEDGARVHGEGRDAARDHLAREVLPLENAQAPASESDTDII